MPLILILLTLTLSGCLPTAFVLGATTGGAVIADRRTVDSMIVDKKITGQALIRILSEPSLKTSHISVSAFNGVVLLVGQTPTEATKYCIFDLIKTIPHIRRINNEIAIAEPLERRERSFDCWITTKVKTAMLAERGLNSTQIKVLTENKTVYLLGLVSHSQAELAINVTRQVMGVTKVMTLFEFIN
jgi:osmotically-inducible protein OsmY